MVFDFPQLRLTFARSRQGCAAINDMKSVGCSVDVMWHTSKTDGATELLQYLLRIVVYLVMLGENVQRSCVSL